MNLKKMSGEELVSYRDDVLEFFHRENTADGRLLNDVHNELLSRLEDGARAIKAMEELNNLFPKCAPSPDRIPLCFVILDQYRSGK